jgi:hypothetical protein
MTRLNGRSWPQFVATFLAAFFGSVGLIYLGIVLLDPYDTGYFPSLIGRGVADDDPRTNSASRGRDVRFDAAIFGNSHGQLLDPGRLSQATGLSFVQLTSLGAGPREQMVLMRYFLRSHPRVRAILIAADSTWCTHDKSLPGLVDNPLPLWLYSGSRLDYLGNVLSSRMFAIVRRRILVATGQLTPTDPAGFSDYEAGRTWNFNPDIPQETPAAPAAPVPKPDTSFPAIDQLDRLATTLPADTSIVIVMMPYFYTWLPAPGTQAAAELAICKDRLAQTSARRPLGGFLDFLVDSSMTRDPANFMDPGHMRHSVSHMIEARIAGILAARAAPSAR